MVDFRFRAPGTPLMVFATLCFTLTLTGLNTPPLAVWAAEESAPVARGEVAPTAVATQAKKLPDGIYVIQRTGAGQDKVEPIAYGEEVILNDYRFLEEAERQTPEYVVVHRESFVPIILKVEPEKGTDTKGKPKILIQFAEDQATKLEEFTRENTGRAVAFVVGEQVVTVHKIREPIVGGRMQITRCSDHGCDAIFSELTKGHKK